MLHLEPGVYGLHSEGYSKVLYEECKLIPGLKWNPPYWTGYYDAVGVVAARCKARGERVEMVPMLNGVNAVESPDLRNYQKEGVNFLVARSSNGVILSDDVGTGKSCQALRAAKAIGKPTLVIYPKFVSGVWGADKDSEVRKWWPEAFPPRVLSGTGGYRLDPALLTCIHYDILFGWAEELAKTIKTVIFDECEFLQSEKSRRSLAARCIASRAEHRIACSATPMRSRPKDLWNVVDTISPGRFGKFFPFALRYCNAAREQVSEFKAVWKFDGSSNLNELKQRLNIFMLRRTKSDVALELPARTRQIIDVEVESSFKINIDEAMASDSALRSALEVASEGKIHPVAELAKSHADNGHNVIVWTHRRALAEAISDQLLRWSLDSMVVHGGYSLAERLDKIHSRPQVLVATMDSIGAGIDLSYSDVAVFAELDWVPSKLVQAEGRQHRFGQKRNCLVQYVIATGTVDEVIRSTVIKKLDTFEAGVGALDDGLHEDLASSTRQAAQLKALYDKLMTE
jgi:SNF2 family DNA or RNA helicase